MNSLYRILFALIAWIIAFPALASVTATLDSNNVASGATVQLRLQHDGTTDSQPDIGPLRRDFDVLGTSSGSSVQIINGHMSSQTQVTVLLSPKHDGKIEIPPLQWGGQQTQAIELTVGGSGAAARPSAQTPSESSHVFLTATLDQKQPYVQAADVLTVRLYADRPVYQASLDLPASGDVLVKQLGKDRQTSETRNGRNYQIVERKYLLFPQRSGKLSLDGPVLDAQVQDTHGNNNDPFGNDPVFGNVFGQMPLAGMLNSTRPIRLHTKPIELNVLQRPASATGADWLPAQNVTLQETWSPDSLTMHVGEPLTRHLHLDASGLTGAQLPDLGTLISAPDGIKAYPDQSKTDDAIQGETVLGRRDQDIALIASHPGRFELPAVRLSWWDTVHNIQHVATLPARVLDILPAIGGSYAAAMPPSANPAQSNQHDIALQEGAPEQAFRNANAKPWMWSSAVFALLWLSTATAWWYTRRRAPPTQSQNGREARRSAVNPSAGAFKAFKSACLNNDAHAARKHLLAWAGSAWPADPPAGLNELSRRLGGNEITGALRQLDRACYTGGSWQGELLARILPAPPALASAKVPERGLPSLYP
ncbi:MAG: BatD family protein [Gallionella sp.]